jgi:hypothetical protein
MSEKSSTATSSGISLGMAIAACISWSQWQSITWAVIHGLFSWGYIIYFTVKDGRL